MPGDDRPILLLGARGQLGRALAPRLATLGPVVAPGRLAADLTRPDSLREVVRRARPRLVVNAAAYTAVDAAERDEERCRLVNAEAPGVLAEEAARLDAPIVHFSTNYVFDGTADRPYREDDPTAPLSVYGRTKLAGERAVATYARHLIFRLAAVYAPTGRNFVGRILDLAREREELRVVEDQLVAPTPASAVADATLAALRGAGPSGVEARGIFHLTAAGSTSWFHFAERVLALDPAPEGRRVRRVRRVVAVRTADLAAPAGRPPNGLLDCGRAARELGIVLPHWEPALERTMARWADDS